MNLIPKTFCSVDPIAFSIYLIVWDFSRMRSLFLVLYIENGGNPNVRQLWTKQCLTKTIFNRNNFQTGHLNMSSTPQSSSPKQTSPGSPRRYCGLGDHFLRPPHKTISDEKMRAFANKINPELRSTTLICGLCYETLKQIYISKLRSAVRHAKRKRALGNTTSVSDVSSSQQSSMESSSKSLSAHVVSTTSSTSTTTQDSTSSSAKRRRVEPAQEPHSTTSVIDDDEPLLSLNAVNGTRLPNIQPIPRRRQFVTLNKTAMDIYLAGTTGG